MANPGLGIPLVIALGIGIVVTLGVLLFGPSQPQSYDHENAQSSRDYSHQNSWSQTNSSRNGHLKKRKQNASKKKESVCTICLIDDNEEYISLRCSHEFHKLCISNWEKQSPTCPICRSEIQL